MTYPILPKAEVKRVVRLRRAGQIAVAAVGAKQLGAAADWEAIATEVAQVFSDARIELSDPNKDGSGRKFEIIAGQALHERLPTHAALADPEFWNWLAVEQFADTIEWRYGTEGDLANYGAGGAQENFIYRLWLRSDIGWEPDASEPYRLSCLGDIDFWRSHLFRQSYADGRDFARAFIRFQFPDGESGRPRLKIGEVRGLAKRLKRARTNLMVEVMDEARASHLIASEWTKLSAE